MTRWLIVLALGVAAGSPGCNRSRKASAQPAAPSVPLSPTITPNVAPEPALEPAPAAHMDRDDAVRFFNLVADLVVEDVQAWSAKQFPTRAEAEQQLLELLDKNSARSGERMQAALKQLNIHPDALLEFVSEDMEGYVHSAEASDFSVRVRAAMDSPEFKAQMDQIERLP